ncbi:MAG: hypothetical protein QOJ94_1379 [Sphingomonadales bacterium]|nr:hypothetical protein [Sphingomonadales bacterium]
MPQWIRPDAFDDLDGLAARFEQASPFPHLVIDDFLLPEVADRLHDEVRHTANNINKSNDITQRLKTGCNDWDLFDEVTFEIISYLNSGAFITPMETISGIDGLFGDPFLEGGGIHQTTRGGFLKMHSDFNWNAKLRADRRINVLLYLNRDWKPEYGGELMIQRLGGDAQKTIEPVFNRLVIFNTNDTTLHGHPFPLMFPVEYPRASIAMYYYSTGVEANDRLRRRATTTRYLPLGRGDISLGSGSLRSRLGYLVRRFTRL